MEAFLSTMVPRIVGDLDFDIRVVQFKHNFPGKLRDRLLGYAAWLPENGRIVVMVDRDDDDCLVLKGELNRVIRDVDTARAHSDRATIAGRIRNRIVIEELESWYFGDWEAVRGAYPRVSPTLPNSRGYRDPDAIRGGTWEALERVLRKAGYYAGGLPKIELAHTIAPLMDPDRNTSHSFQVWLRTMRSLSE